MHDVLVIGGGMAGTIAALAARQTGANVALASRSWGATALSTGALDIAFTPALSPSERVLQTLTGHVEDIIAHRSRHPYSLLGIAQTQAKLAEAYGLLQKNLQGSGLDLDPLDMARENCGLASSLGAILPAATAFLPHRGLNLATAGRWGVLHFLGDAYFDAERLRRGLTHDGQQRGTAVEWTQVHTTYPAAATPMALARQLDDRAAAEQLARDLAPRIKGLAGLLIPPVLGLERYGQLRTWLSDSLGLPVVEALAHMPSVPGVRLQRALEAALQRAGVHNVGEVVTPSLDGNRVRAVVTRDNLEIRATSFVLATGRFIAGGLRWDTHCVESLFGLPAVTELGLLEDDSPETVVRPTPVESHPLMTAGIKINRQLQPMREGRLAFANVFAAGMVIGGFASRYALCADGVALATGLIAGQSAAATRS